jgi:hypothetical protein
MGNFTAVLPVFGVTAEDHTFPSNQNGYISSTEDCSTMPAAESSKAVKRPQLVFSPKSEIATN